MARNKMWCSYCGRDTHTLKNCPKTAGGQGSRRSMFCSYCGSREHTIRACPKRATGEEERSRLTDDQVRD